MLQLNYQRSERKAVSGVVVPVLLKYSRITHELGGYSIGKELLFTDVGDREYKNLMTCSQALSPMPLKRGPSGTDCG